jgi:hypothetical protein
MNTHIRWKYVECLPLENESTPRVMTVWHNVCRTSSCVQGKKLFEFLKYNNICSVFWFVKRHSFKPHAFHFQLNYECDVIFAVPEICAYFVDNPHNLEIDSFKIAVSEHILLYFKNYEWRFTNQNTLKVVLRKNSFCMDINRV